MDAERYYQYFGNVYQDFARYKMSFSENISVGDVEHLEDAARIAEAKRILSSLLLIKLLLRKKELTVKPIHLQQFLM